MTATAGTVDGMTDGTGGVGQTTVAGIGLVGSDNGIGHDFVVSTTGA